MGFGGPEFAKDKANLSRECKLQRDNPVPPVDQECFNDDGDCVPEGNVLQQIKVPYTLLDFNESGQNSLRRLVRCCCCLLVTFCYNVLFKFFRNREIRVEILAGE